MAIEDFAVHFIQNRALFGAYPTQERVQILEHLGINLIVNLTYDNEKHCVPYKTSIPILHFPIRDGRAPKNKLEFCKIIISVSERIDNGDYIFIHCKGGHGRSGMFVAALMAYRLRIEPKIALNMTAEWHSKRTNIKPYRRKNAQTWEQKQFVYSIGRIHTIGPQSVFFNLTPIEAYFETFLLQTYLGPIIGENGKELEDRRKQLIMEGF